MNVLFVCTMNYQRSKTGEEIYKDDNRFVVRSAGVSKDAFTRINTENLEWADIIIVMERNRRNRIRKEFPQIYQDKRIICLYIEDEYDYMENGLIDKIRLRFEKIYDEELKFL